MTIHSVAASGRSRLAVAILLAASCAMAANAEDKPAVVTAGQPAVVDVRPPVQTEATVEGNDSLIVQVTGFKPPTKGSVQAVVTVKGESAQQGSTEIGRFGVFPNDVFTAGSGDPQRFRLTLSPKASGLLQQQKKISVELVPSAGTGDGARLEIGGVNLAKKPNS